MTIELTRWTGADHDSVRALVGEPLLAPQFDKLLGPGRLEHWMADPFCDPRLRWIARLGGSPVGFAYAFLLRGGGHSWAMLRIGVTAAARRQGVGSRLYGAQLEDLAEHMPECREVCISAWEPCPEAAGFTARQGFRPVRQFWRMERRAGALPAPGWPAGITVRVFDGSEAALGDWSDVYNRSFARHYHFVPSTIGTCRALAEVPGFDPSSLLLAFDGAGCVGFCRNEVQSYGGEIEMLGVAPAWQGRGLGRALLREGARWLADRAALPILLMVDGENDSALRLYRSEGFEIARTRPVWSRVIDGR